MEAVEGVFFYHIGQQQGGDKAHSLAVPHLGVQRRVPQQHLPQRGLALPAVLVEQLVLRKCAVNIAANLFACV